jgi:hypothetical protein
MNFNNFLKNSKTILLIIIISQILLCYFAFYDIISYPNKYIFHSIYDGLKNYYVVISYLQQDIGKDILLFNGFNYPFGENIFYIDNTPIFSLFYKYLIMYNIADQSNAIYHFNLFLVFCIVLSSVVTYKIVSNFSQNRFVLIFSSVSIPWICQQINRLSIGHFNLSISLYILLGIYFCIKIYKKNNAYKSYYKELIYLYILFIVSAFTHFYYFPILLFFIGLFFLINYIDKIISKSNDTINYILKTSFTLVLSTVSIYLIITFFDTQYNERIPITNGYDWQPWKLNFHALFNPNDYNNAKFLFSSAKLVPLESNAYLGAGTLYLLFTVLILFFIKKERLHIKEYIKNSKYSRLLGYLLLSTFICFLISMGNSYYFENNEYFFTNYLNPLFYLADILPIIKQFRCLARFSWPFILIIQLGLVYIASYLLTKNNYFKTFTYLFIFLNFYNAIDAVNYYHNHFYENPFYKGNLTNETKEILENIDTTRYQAILTIPFYHSGSEDYSITIDPDDEFAKSSMQLAYFCKLPLISSKLGRTSIRDTKSLFEIYTAGRIPIGVKKKLSSKPILVYVDKAYYNGTKNWPINEREPANTALKNGINLINSENCTKIYQKGDLELYEMKIIN